MSKSKLHSLLIKHEALKLKPYHCTAGKLTIGVGRNLDDVGISEEEALYLLDQDLKRVEMETRKAFKWFKDLDEVRQDIVLNMVFNLGISRFSKFKKTIKHIELGEYDQASVEMLNSSWANQVGERANELSEMMKKGEYL